MTQPPAKLLNGVTLSRARRMRRAPTDAERKLWLILRDRALGAKFRRQQPIGPFIVDFCCLERRLVIELDGGQHATLAAADQKRTQFLNAEGYKVIRFWNDDVMRDPSPVIEAILKALDQPPSPSRHGAC